MSQVDATPIISLPGYFVSSSGQVFRGPKELSGTVKHGYKAVQVAVDGSYKSVLVHRLVAEVFLGLNRNDTKVLVDHIDKDKANNNVANLRLVTHLQNRLHAVGRLDNQSAMHKKCGKCEQSKRLFEFAIRAKNSDGKSAYCKTCEKEMRECLKPLQMPKRG